MIIIMISITINISNKNPQYRTMEQRNLGRKVRTFEDYFNTCERGGWLLPSFNSAIVTRSYLDAIRKGHYYCPHRRHNIK